ncbi:MAG: hypothetical protein FWG30_04655 [Eubacteriaceae bacterium]|nr:hypothetical protein [Eubacteriaceae bacterium]
MPDSPTPPNFKESLINYIFSIAMQELALSNIINTEGKKLQYALGTSDNALSPKPTVDEVVNLNKSIQSVLTKLLANHSVSNDNLSATLNAYLDSLECDEIEGGEPVLPPDPIVGDIEIDVDGAMQIGENSYFIGQNPVTVTAIPHLSVTTDNSVIWDIAKSPDASHRILHTINGNVVTLQAPPGSAGETVTLQARATANPDIVSEVKHFASVVTVQGSIRLDVTGAEPTRNPSSYYIGPDPVIVSAATMLDGTDNNDVIWDVDESPGSTIKYSIDGNDLIVQAPPGSIGDSIIIRARSAENPDIVSDYVRLASSVPVQGSISLDVKGAEPSGEPNAYTIGSDPVTITANPMLDGTDNNDVIWDVEKSPDSAIQYAIKGNEITIQAPPGSTGDSITVRASSAENPDIVSNDVKLTSSIPVSGSITLNVRGASPGGAPNTFTIGSDPVTVTADPMLNGTDNNSVQWQIEKTPNSSSIEYSIDGNRLTLNAPQGSEGDTVTLRAVAAANPQIASDELKFTSTNPANPVTGNIALNVTGSVVNNGNNTYLINGPANVMAMAILNGSDNRNVTWGVGRTDVDGNTINYTINGYNISLMPMLHSNGAILSLQARSVANPAILSDVLTFYSTVV